MEKRLKIFIVIAVVLIVIIGSIRIKQEIETSAGTLAEANAETSFGISEEGIVYVIGTHLFTEKTEYLSTEMMINAAKTVEDLPDGLKDEEVLERITVYARDAEGNWIDALKGTKMKFPADFEFNIKYIDSVPVKEEEPVNPPVEVATLEEFVGAVSDSSITDIKLTENIKIEDTLNVEEKTFTIDLNGKEIDCTQITSGTAINIKSGKLVINGENGSIKDGNNVTLYNEGVLEINNVTISGYKYPIYTESSTEKQAITTINKCDITGTGTYCVINRTNATTNVNDSTIDANIPLADNGIEHNSIFNITNSIITGVETAIYKPATGKLNIEKSTLSGQTGIIICAGDLNIKNSTINGTGNYLEVSDVSKQTGGFDSEGSGILASIRSGYDDGGNMNITIDDKTTINSEASHGIRITEYVRNTKEKHGVSDIMLEYYSSKINSLKDKVMIETLGEDYLTIRTTNKSNGTIASED